MNSRKKVTRRGPSNKWNNEPQASKLSKEKNLRALQRSQIVALKIKGPSTGRGR